MSEEEGWASTRGTRTDPGSPDPRLRGRTYAIPFERVWNEAVALVGGGIRHWGLVSADDRRGVIVGESKRPVRPVVDVRVVVGLDEDGQTRVDVWVAPRGGLGSLLPKARTIGHFLSKLDARLAAAPGRILHSSRTPARRA